MRGHHHNGDPSLTQNQGNTLGDRPCVRQSRLYREHVGGNTMKDIMGQTDLKWDTTQTQGVYAGGRVYDHNNITPDSANTAPCNRVQQEQLQQPVDDVSHEVEISMNAGESPLPYVTPVQASNGVPPMAKKAVEAPTEPQHAAAPVAGRGFRPGAGQANRQTYNIFTGE